jgi:hypothetical protein
MKSNQFQVLTEKVDGSDGDLEEEKECRKVPDEYLDPCESLYGPASDARSVAKEVTSKETNQQIQAATRDNKDKISVQYVESPSRKQKHSNHLTP